MFHLTTNNSRKSRALTNMKKSGSYSDVFQACCRCVRNSRSKSIYVHIKAFQRFWRAEALLSLTFPLSPSNKSISLSWERSVSSKMSFSHGDQSQQCTQSIAWGKKQQVYVVTFKTSYVFLLSDSAYILEHLSKKKTARIFISCSLKALVIMGIHSLPALVMYVQFRVYGDHEAFTRKTSMELNM